MRFKKFAGVAAGALVAGSLSFVAAPAAQAASATDVVFNCAFGTSTFTYTTDVNISSKWNPETSLTTASFELLDEMPNAAPAFVSQPNVEMTFTVNAIVNPPSWGAAPAPHAFVGTKTENFQGGTPVAVPVLSGDAPYAKATQSFKITGFQFSGGGTVIDCTSSAATVTGITIDTSAASLKFDCKFNGASPFPYYAVATVKAKRLTENGVSVGLGFSKLPNPAPAVAVLAASDHATVVNTQVNGEDHAFSSTVNQDFVGGTPIGTGPLSADIARVDKVDVVIEDFALTVSKDDDSYAIACTLPAAVTASADVVDVFAAEGVVAAAQATVNSATAASNSAAAAAAKAKTSAAAAVNAAKAAVAATSKAKAAADSAAKAQTKANNTLKSLNKKYKKAKKAKKKALKKKVNAAKRKLNAAKSANSKAAAAFKAAQTTQANAQTASTNANAAQTKANAAATKAKADLATATTALTAAQAALDAANA